MRMQHCWRSKTFLKYGHDNKKGVYQKAEALYNRGDFELALVYYHRGNQYRPEVIND